ncbi:mycofactocin system GMC family oxidoreductase MftG [uncultured Jatrophihabitans sp.]|uniref:mycofactocin dehydrogenase MftG n=1 Tax=uncultured Jatrophihabitans sp. TaxID=1610747 RepID=UPI0035C9FD24
MIVVGAGTAGCALAARLSEDADRRVLLVEAGPAPASSAGFAPELLDASGVRAAASNSGYTWSYPAHLTDRHPHVITRGRVLGGSSTVNGGYFVRATRADFAAWSADGRDAWSHDSVLPLLCALEHDLDYGRTALHGDAGPIPVRRPTLDSPSAAAFAAAADELGIPTEPDKNGDAARPGFGPVPVNALDGVRWNTGLAYLLPALARPNLDVLADSAARRVVVERGRAVGVEVATGGRVTVWRGAEIVLCAGAIGSAHLLLLSGVGPAADLTRVDVPVVLDAPGVGARFDDHPQVVLEWLPKAPQAPPPGQWLAGAVNLDELPGGSLEILQSSAPMSTVVTGVAAPPLAPLPLLVSVQQRAPRGVVRLVSADASTPPAVEHHYLGDGPARQALRAVVRLAADLLQTRAWSAVSAGVVNLDREVVRDDAALDAWIHARLGTSAHTCGTAPFGYAADPGAVVDQHGRVHGVDALRVADTSILPTAPTRGPAATAVLIGELIAAAMRRGT